MKLPAPLYYLITLITLAASVCAEPPAGKDWTLVFEDEFDYSNEVLDENWDSQNGPSTHILSSRYRDNAVVSNGKLELQAKKEKRGGQEWTAGSIWTRQAWQYGYFECRYKYAAASGTNNSFWIMTQSWQNIDEDKGLKRFEIDINEGHYPDEINTNLHNHTDQTWNPEHSKPTHPAWPKPISLTSRENSRADREIIFDMPIMTTKVRLSSKHPSYFHIRSLRLFSESKDGYPAPFDDAIPEGLVDYAKNAQITASPSYSPYKESHPPTHAIDNDIESSWIALGQEEAFIILDLGEQAKEIGCVQFVTGWYNAENNGYIHYIHDYRLEVWDGSQWVEVAALEDNAEVKVNLAETFHVYALEWNEDELIYYFDGEPIRRLPNYCAHSPAPVWLSLAIMHGAGMVGPEIDGTHMEVDYVRIWQERGKETVQSPDWRNTGGPSN